MAEKSSFNTEAFANWCAQVYTEHKCDPWALYLTPESRAEWEAYDDPTPYMGNLMRNWPTGVINPVTGRNMEILTRSPHGAELMDHFLTSVYLYGTPDVTYD